MSGHSKWAKVHRQKTITDAKKGAVFTKLGNLITVAAKEGGEDIETNFKLRLAVEKARQANMPKDNIDRAIKKGAGLSTGKTALAEITYEAFGPSGSVFVIEAITDNKNRTVADLKAVLNKNGGQLGGPNSTLWQFERKGLILIDKNQLKNKNTDDLELDLIEAGADGLKVGIGPSPVCTTRIIAGAGVPQITAIIDVMEVAQKYHVPVCADGGMKFPGDVAKALAAGASSIFSGYLFAGTDEAPGMIIMKDGKRYKKYMGSASYDSSHERRELSQGKQVKERLDVFVEGVAILVDYKGPVRDVINSLLKGVQSGMSYCGARTIQEMQANAEFIQITSAGWEESKERGQKLSE